MAKIRDYNGDGTRLLIIADYTIRFYKTDVRDTFTKECEDRGYELRESLRYRRGLQAFVTIDTRDRLVGEYYPNRAEAWLYKSVPVLEPAQKVELSDVERRLIVDLLRDHLSFSNETTTRALLDRATIGEAMAEFDSLPEVVLLKKLDEDVARMVRRDVRDTLGGIEDEVGEAG